MSQPLDIAIVGGGAAGLATAIFAGESAPPGTRIAVLDGASKLGAKILVAGGGRCNVTHDRITPDDYNGPRNVVRNILRAFDEKQTVDWLAAMGVQLKTEPTGKLFPVTDRAKTVLDALLNRCGELGVDLRTGHRVSDVRREGDRWCIRFGHGEATARRLVLATGGRSLPRTGSDGGMYPVVRRLGHTITDTYAALAPMVLDSKFFHGKLSGVSHEATLTTLHQGKRIDRRRGSLLWTHFGISGPVAMDASRHWQRANADGQATMQLGLFDGDFQRAQAWLLASGGATLGATMRSRWPARVVETLCARVGVDPDVSMDQLRRDDRRRLAHALTELPLPVLRDRGWNYAEVTAGGVPMSEVDPKSMRSRVADALYLVGELLDVDGRIGGFNFQWAWATGHLAGRAMSDC